MLRIELYFKVGKLIGLSDRMDGVDMLHMRCQAHTPRMVSTRAITQVANFKFGNLIGLGEDSSI